MMEPRIVLHPFPVNLRVSAENLVGFVDGALHRLKLGDIFVFFNRKRDRCRIVWHSGDGLSSLEKVLQKGTFAAPDKIKIKQSVIDDFFNDGINGPLGLVHALVADVLYLDDARERRLD